MRRLLGILLVALSAFVVPGLAGEANRDFSSWRDFYAYVAKDLEESMDTTPERVFDLAADSDKQPSQADQTLILVQANLYHCSGGMLFNDLRGASNNGPFYLIKRTEKGIHLVGKMEGSRCIDVGISARIRQYECSWHMGGGSSRVAKYETDGVSLKYLEGYSIEDGKRQP